MIGMNIRTNNVPFAVCNPGTIDSVRNGLINVFKDCQAKLQKRCQMLVCIMDKSVPTLYATIKRICLTQAGVISQCMLFKHVQNPSEIKDTYIFNVALKANIKLGGASNHVSALGNLPNDLTLFMGADVTHAHPGSNAPSIAAVVASVDGKATRYHTYIKAQG
jgi:eukaryotic translation initiation factor 2C